MKDAPRTLDLRGRACPEPVVETLKVLSSGQAPAHLVVLVDNAGSAENVRRAAASRGRTVELIERGPGQIEVHAHGQAGAPAPGPSPEELACPAGDRLPRLAVLLACDTLGSGDDELGGLLMRAFVKTLKETSPRPHWLLLLHRGVRLACEGSPLLADLEALRADGTILRVCGTCLDYYGLKDHLRVGEVGNMFDTVSALCQADRVVRP
jgi:selenium metabolism protein YedF